MDGLGRGRASLYLLESPGLGPTPYLHSSLSSLQQRALGAEGNGLTARPEPHFLVWKGVAYFPVLPAAAQAVMSLIVTEKGL